MGVYPFLLFCFKEATQTCSSYLKSHWLIFKDETIFCQIVASMTIAYFAEYNIALVTKSENRLKDSYIEVSSEHVS